MNILRTGLLLAALTALFLLIGYLLGGKAGAFVALAVSVATNALAYWNSDKMVLRLYGAKEIDRGSARVYFDLVSDLARRAAVPMPRLFLIDSPQPNAFATGRDPEHAAVAATTGLLSRLSGEELKGVLAHELSHIKNRDTLTMTITATIAGAISMIANYGLFFGLRNERNNSLGPLASLLMLIFAPLAAMLVQMAISRTREYSADRSGAVLSGQPLALAAALKKIAAEVEEVPNERAEANPATAHLFIINPLAGIGRDSLFSTHPSTVNRIAALESLALQMPSLAPLTSRSVSVPSVAPRKGPWG